MSALCGSILAALQLNALHHLCASARSACKDNCELCAEQAGSRRLQLDCDNHEVIWVMPNCSPFCSSAILTLCLYCHLMVVHYSRHVRSWQSQAGSLVVATARHVLVMLNGDLICSCVTRTMYVPTLCLQRYIMWSITCSMSCVCNPADALGK